MIQAADAGVGIEGKEGRQASLAADFSITQFRYLGRLLVWHGRNRFERALLLKDNETHENAFVLVSRLFIFFSYKRSAALSQFVIHRGLIISVMQVSGSFRVLHVYCEIYSKLS